MATKSITETVQDQTLEAVQNGQQVVLDALEAWVGAYAGLVPEKLTLPSLPEGFPKPQEALESSFAFVGSLLTLQKDFAFKLLALAEPAAKGPVRAAKTA